MNQKEELIFNLIFSKNTDFEIYIEEYIINIYEYDIFVDEIRYILLKSKVMLVKDTIIADDKSIIWKIKVKK
jgi:hypothetical protein